MIDGDEISETARQAFGFDRRCFVLTFGAWRYDDFLMMTALLRRKQRNECIVQRTLIGLGEDLLRRALRDDLAIIHRGEPIEPACLIHVCGCDDHAHHWPAFADGID